MSYLKRADKIFTTQRFYPWVTRDIRPHPDKQIWHRTETFICNLKDFISQYSSLKYWNIDRVIFYLKYIEIYLFIQGKEKRFANWHSKRGIHLFKINLIIEVIIDTVRRWFYILLSPSHLLDTASKTNPTFVHIKYTDLIWW